MYAETSRRREDSRCNNSPLQCFKTTNCDGFHCHKLFAIVICRSVFSSEDIQYSHVRGCYCKWKKDSEHRGFLLISNNILQNLVLLVFLIIHL